MHYGPWPSPPWLNKQASERVFDQWQQILARQKVNSDHTASEFDAIAAPPVLFEQAGVIQAIHLRGLVATAADHDCLTILGHTAGDFVAPGDVFVEIKTRVGGKPFLSPDPKAAARTGCSGRRTHD
jgi:hypothetical protein